MNEKKNRKSRGVIKTKILVVDDHPVVRDGLTMLLNCEADMTVVARAGDAKEAVEAVKKYPIDVAIIDMLFENTTGVEITQQVKALSPNLIVLMFSMSDRAIYVRQAFKAGARGYITKDEVSEKIIYAIRQVLQEKTYLSERLSKMFTKSQLIKLLTVKNTPQSGSD